MRFIFLFSTSTLTGQAAQSYNIIRYLIKSGHRVWVVSDQQRDGDLNGYIERSGAILIKNVSISNRNKLSGKFREINSLRSLIMDLRPDFVVSSFSNDHFLIWIARRKIDYTFKVIRFFHSRSVSGDFLHKGLFSNTDAFIFYDYDIYTKFKRRHSHLTDRLYLFPTSVDTELFAPRDTLECKRRIQIEENSFVMGYVGMFQKGRRHRELIDAFIKLREWGEELKFIMVGGGETLEEIKRYALNNRYSSEIIFTGFVDNDSLVSAYNAMDIFVLPSGGHDSSLRMLYEAQSCGTYILSYDNFHIRRLIESAGYGGVLHSARAEEIAKTISVIKSNLKRIDRGEIHKRIASKFSIEIGGEGFIKVCEGLIKRD